MNFLVLQFIFEALLDSDGKILAEVRQLVA